ncbi:cilia- and flagella-associated protein 418-like isoform X2 [Dermacentor silvarum]|uniref:cilia- and flagella-associated protein 418-like isoform X2 n=1 Tax=Dermacentor silvarum TaxID=543639 RepID=UPI0021008485|nr:cilia- and flagella-associated protein 418-like isoform X2 [Dermacentor silvarum]
MQQFLANSMRMEDDIDALLDDVEAKYCERMCQRASAPTAGTSSDDSIEEAINEICRVPEFNVPNRDLTESKLFGGRNIQACSHIHCCKCDFQVSVFEDFAWDETADYLFFRNSVPDASKLRSRLFRKLGWRAYCCQCHWRSVAALASAQQERLPWMCARH